MSPLPVAKGPSSRSLTHARLRAVRQVFLLASLFNVGLNSVAHAFVGQALLGWAQLNIIAPIGLISVVVAIGGALFRPEMVSKALYAAIICVVLFFILNSAGAVITAIST
jgi:hypothetical protein